MRWGVVDSSERLSELSNVYPWYGDLGVLIKVEDRDREISITWRLGMSTSLRKMLLILV